MEAVIKKALNTSVLKRTGRGGGGCINEGEAYLTDTGTVFVKHNSKSQSRLMFDGEYESLRVVYATDTVRVPQPIQVLDNPKGGAMLIMEYLDMKALNKHSRKLGGDLARLHMHNAELKKKQSADEGKVNKSSDDDEGRIKYVDKFGFHTTTCCGYLPMDNTWCDDWVTFLTRQRLDHQMNLIEKNHGDRQAMELWKQLQPKIPSFFKDIEIVPSLLHGDLWGGNIAEVNEGPVIFDPASFYGHHEFELAIAGMFGGFNKTFYDSYHSIIPKAPGFETRQRLYQLFHYLNHWNHFGAGYKGSSLATMRSLCQ